MIHFVPDFRGGGDGGVDGDGNYNETHSLSLCSMGDDLQDFEEFSEDHFTPSSKN